MPQTVIVFGLLPEISSSSVARDGGCCYGCRCCCCCCPPRVVWMTTHRLPSLCVPLFYGCAGTWRVSVSSSGPSMSRRSITFRPRRGPLCAPNFVGGCTADHEKLCDVGYRTLESPSHQCHGRRLWQPPMSSLPFTPLPQRPPVLAAAAAFAGPDAAVRVRTHASVHP